MLCKNYFIFQEQHRRVHRRAITKTQRANSRPLRLRLHNKSPPMKKRNTKSRAPARAKVELGDENSKTTTWSNAIAKQCKPTAVRYSRTTFGGSPIFISVLDRRCARHRHTNSRPHINQSRNPIGTIQSYRLKCSV